MAFAQWRNGLAGGLEHCGALNGIAGKGAEVTASASIVLISWVSKGWRRADTKGIVARRRKQRPLSQQVCIAIAEVTAPDKERAAVTDDRADGRCSHCPALQVLVTAEDQPA
jgi:hypothetical protein